MSIRSHPLRMLVVEPSGNLYGSELCLLDILEGISLRHFAVNVCLPKQAAFSELLAARHMPFAEILLPNAHRQSHLNKLLMYLRLARHVRQTKPDLIYLNEGGMLRPLVWIARTQRVPLVCQIQTKEDALWISSLPPSFHQQTAAFICNSDFTASCATVPPQKKSVIYYGYRAKNLKGQRRKQPGKRFMVGLLGRIGGTKGHDLVLDATEELVAAGKSGRLVFRFIGAAPTETEDEQWKSEVESRGLSNMIEFRGYRTDIATELADLDLMIIPSISEPFGRILCEAAEARCPVLLSDSGGLGELSRRFDIGVRHRPRDIQDFTKQLLWAMDNYTTINTQFQTAASRLLGSLDYNTYVARVGEILTEAAAGRNVSVEWRGLN